MVRITNNTIKHFKTAGIWLHSTNANVINNRILSGDTGASGPDRAGDAIAAALQVRRVDRRALLGAGIRSVQAAGGILREAKRSLSDDLLQER